MDNPSLECSGRNGTISIMTSCLNFWSSRAGPDHQGITRVFNYWCDVLEKCCISFNPDRTRFMTFKESSTFDSWLHRIISKSLGEHKDVRISFDKYFDKMLSYCGIVTTDPNLGKWDMKLLCFLLLSQLFVWFLLWTSGWVTEALEGTLVGWSELRKVHHYYIFLHL